MKKHISLFLSILLLMSILPGCGQSLSTTKVTRPNAMMGTSANENILSIVTTIFPVYDWMRQILGDRSDQVNLTLLLENGSDLHSYQPTAKDMVTISNCDMFVYVGGESDEWVKDALANATNKNMVAVNLMDVLGDSVKEEEIVEGMEHDHHHDHDESEAHSKEVSTFEDNQVQDRSLKDWAGEWQSAYPYVLDGSLDEGFAHKAKSGKMSAEEYKAYYATGYETELKTIAIDGDTNTITYTDVNGKTCASPYKYVGYYIQDWSTGTRAAMYRFEAVDKASGTPIFVEFNDHIIEPCPAEHFHFRSSNTGFDDIEDPENRWPTFFPAAWKAEDILEAFIGHDHSDEDDHHHEDGEVEYDEHVWLSLKNAAVLCAELANQLSKLDADHQEVYATNAMAYIEKLSALDVKYQEAATAAKVKTVLFGDRFPFRYLVDDYGLDYYAAFVGCSAETEASFETIIFLANKVDELGLNSVLTIESGDGKIARTIIENTAAKSAQVLQMDSMQSTTAQNVADGATYLGTMEKNLDVLKEALK